MNRIGRLIINPISYAEDDDTRSNYVRSLIQNNNFFSVPTLEPKTIIPKVIIQFWDDLSCIPNDVQECFNLQGCYQVERLNS